MKLNFLLVITVGIFSLSIYSQSKIKDGTVTGSSPAPVSNAILELESNNKGFLATRISLASNIDNVTIPSPTTGLLVFNTGTAGLKYKGYVYWSGTEWVTFTGQTLSLGFLGSIECNNASLNPINYSTGVPYSGTLSVPYVGGDGGIYYADTIVANGLTAILPAGRLERGEGYLVYSVSGIPLVSSPTTTSFAINIGGNSCIAEVGVGKTITVGDIEYYKGRLLASSTNHWLSDSLHDLPILGGKIRLDGFFSAHSNGTFGHVSFNPRLVNVSNAPVKIWYSALSTVDNFSAANLLMAANGYANLDNGIYLGTGSNMILGTSTPEAAYSLAVRTQEVLVCDLVFDNKWYRIYYFPTVDNMNLSGTATNQRVMYISVQRLF